MCVTGLRQASEATLNALHEPRTFFEMYPLGPPASRSDPALATRQDLVTDFPHLWADPSLRRGRGHQAPRLMSSGSFRGYGPVSNVS
jgi:hypothetical protein